jgi:hypothetical protein
LATRILAVALLIGSTTATAQTQSELTPDQRGYIAYDQCLMYAAMRVSKTDAKDEAVYGLAKAECAPVRVSVLVGQEKNRAFIAALDAVDADKAANFPSWINGVRERRRLRDAQFPMPAAK